MIGTVAIVGSPSVGKSTIFNRILGERKSIVEERRGVTRDRIYAKASWLTRDFFVIDTGGIEIENRPFQEQIRAQVEIAINEANVILFVVDGKVGLTDDDKLVASMLHKSKKPIVLAVNKIDDNDLQINIYDFYALGIGDPIPVSGAHGIGIGDVLDDIIKKLPDETEDIVDNSIKFSVIGRPNVGKSSLVNAILKQDRVIVSNIEGTTRDAIDTKFVANDREFTIIDTAGLKKKGKIFESVDKYAALRALKAIDESDVCLLVIDAEKGLIDQDKHVVGYAMDSKKAIIIVVNKWDAIDKDNNTVKEFTEKIRADYKFLDYAPIVFVSALSGQRINTLLPLIEKVYDSYTFDIKTSVLNEIIQTAQMMNESPHFNGGRVKIYYAQQVSSKPVTIALFCNEPTWMHFSYLRYIENQIRDSFELIGSPINLVCRKRK
ncbi:MAG: ribosome biogenesis GTPase Der [Bacilli bacterium]|nr:ribosome biogenesis GTPase Der [Bacilli bacterium]